jgi:holo-[acyl-carrier protein] synthase
VIGLGIDSVDIHRFRTLLDRRPVALERLFTARERDLVAERADPVPSLAARFAAKEAVMKALGVGLGAFKFVEVEVRREEMGAPSLALSGAAAALASRRGVSQWFVSLTHTDTVASAVVLGHG